MSFLQTKTINDPKLHWMQKKPCDDSVHSNSEAAQYLVRDGTCAKGPESINARAPNR